MAVDSSLKPTAQGGSPSSAPSDELTPSAHQPRRSLHPDLKNQRIFPGPLYFLSFATRSDLWLYALATACGLCSALPFAAVDLTYGHWTSGLVPRDGAATPDGIRAVSRQVALISIGITLGMLLFTAGFFFCFGLASQRVTNRMRYAYLAAVLSQPATYFESVGPGEVASRMSKDLGAVSTGIGEKLGFASWSVGAILTGVIISFDAAPKVGGVLFSILPFALFCFGVAGWLSSAAADRISKAEGNAATFLEQVLSTCRTVRVLKASDSLIAVYDKFLADIERDGTLLAISEGVTYGVAYFGIFTAYALSFYYGGQQIAYHGLDSGKLVTSFFSIFNALFAVTNLLPHLVTLNEAIAAMGRMRIEIDRVSSIDPRGQSGLVGFPTDMSRENNARAIGREIEVRNVTFEFPSRPGKKALNNVSLRIEKGKVTALVGHSGSGKSTVTALLLRQYDLPDPSSTTSNIFIDSVPLASLKVSFLRQQIAIVSQDPQLSSGSILDNVSTGLTGTPNERSLDGSNDQVVRQLCTEALEMAQAWDFVSRLPDGVDSVVSGARTGVLSGGQRQRIAVARALVRKASILVIDEGTSALDSSSESLLMERIAEEQRALGMTVILIAHRLSTVRSADKIIVMGQGHMLEEGTHESLSAKKGEYWKMTQLSHGILPEDLEEPAKITSGNASPESSVTLSLSDHPIGEEEAKNERVASSPVLRARLPLKVEEAQVGLPPDKEYRSRFTRFASYPLRRTRWLVPGILAALGIGAAFPLSAWMLGQVLHAFSLPYADDISTKTKFWALMFTMVAIGTCLFSLIEAWFLINGAQKVTRQMRREGAHAVLRQEIAWFEAPDNGAGALTASIGKHPTTVVTPLGMTGGQSLTSTGNFLGSMILGFTLSWNLLLVGISPLLLLIPIGYFELHYGAKYEEEACKSVDLATSFGTEAVDSVKNLAAFGQELQILRKLDMMQQPNYRERNKLAALAAFFFGFSQAIVPIILALFFWYGGHELANGNASISTVYSVFEAALIGAFSLSRLFSFSGDYSRAIHGFRSFAEWLERTPVIATLPSSRPPSPEKSAGPATIEIENLNFSYPSRPGKPAISDLTLTIRAGEKIAFCGPSGGGKSSILACLARFYDPNSGRILVNGRDVRSIALEDHWGSIAMVAQDATLYAGTVRFNLTLGLEYIATDAEVEHACRQARIWDFVQTLDNGVDTELGLKGLNLSGGQRQRLCIARALLRKAKILLLDEATSALDNESESLVQEALDRAAVGRTTVVIAHRLSTIRNADRIVVIEEGRILEIGSHADLLRKGGRYVELIEAQL